MPPGRVPGRRLVRPEFGPSLPTLVRERLGVPERVTTTLVTVAVVLMAVGGGLLARRGDGTTEVAVRSAPAFTMAYPSGAVHVRAPRPGERLHLSGRRNGVRVDVVVRPLRLPPYRGQVATGLLPSFAEQYVERLRRRRRWFVLRDEGRGGVGRTAGYQLRFRTGPPGRQTYWHDILLAPHERGARVGAVVSLRHAKPGAAYTDADRSYVLVAKRVQRSFRFVT